MPPPRRSPQRSKYRRSRSRSYSPRHRRSRSHSRNRKRSRSHERHRSRSRDRLRSRSRDRRRSRSREPRRSRSPYRKRSESPVVLRAEERGFPVKRPADSSNKRLAHRSPSPSPPPRHKKLRDEPSGRRLGMRAPSPYSGKAESQKPSTSRAPLFPAASTKRTEIDFVVITDKRPKEKLNKRFQAVDQGRFDFDENITIGIHRGPGHIHLDHDEDIEVNYAFNPKSFKMLFPKKDYVKNIFDRDEILVFQHDAVLDEEAYVEKRTISVQPVERSRSRHAHDDLDYKITVGGDRSLSGDRRRVQDSGFRSGDYDRNIPVTVRLDPKPDPRYERLYKAQQRHEEGPELGASGQRSPHRSPHDLRYNLNRRKTDDGRHSDVLDARTRIVARRQDSFDDDVPSAMRDSKRPMGRTDLPDFKNRPDDRSDEQPAQRWGFCKICNVPLHSESEANDHVNGIQHQSNEAALDQGELHEMPDHSFRGANPRGRGRGRGRGGARGGWAGRGRWRPAVDTDKHDKRPTDGKPVNCWIVGNGQMMALRTMVERSNDLNLGLNDFTLLWHCKPKLTIRELPDSLRDLKVKEDETPDFILLSVGGYEICDSVEMNFKYDTMDVIDKIQEGFPSSKLIWCQLLPDSVSERSNLHELNQRRNGVDDVIGAYVLEKGGRYIRVQHDLRDKNMFRVTDEGKLLMSIKGLHTFHSIIKGGLLSIAKRGILIHPEMKALPKCINQFVYENKHLFQRKFQKY